MKKCSHGVYNPDNSDKAYSCEACYPGGHPENTGGLSPRDLASAKRALHHAFKRALERLRLRVECADCGYIWRTISDYPVCPKCKSGQVDEWIQDGVSELNGEDE